MQSFLPSTPVLTDTAIDFESILNPKPSPKPKKEENKLPSWVIPASVAGAGLLIFLMVGKK
jgi:hypothetical protein